MAESPALSGFFEPAQFQAVMAALRKHVHPLVAFGYETGWRLREITSRRWRHMDLEAGMVRLEPGESKSEKPREGVRLARVARHSPRAGREGGAQVAR
jgi:integrase